MTADNYTIASGATLYAGCAAPVSSPAWLAALSPLTWAEVGNLPTSIDPANDPTINPVMGAAPWAALNNLAGSTNDYSGAVWDEVNGRFSVYGGGHAGFFGNFMPGIDLLVDAPVWARHGYPSGSIQKPCASMYATSADPSLMADGRPSAVHTYNLLVPLPSGDTAVLPGGFAGVAPDGHGGAPSRGYLFRRATDDWDVAAAINLPVTGTYAGGGCYDPVRALIWQLQGDRLNSYDATTLAGTSRYYLNGGGVGYCKLIYDTIRNLILVCADATGVDGHTGKCIFLIDPANPVAGLTAINVSGESVNWALQGMDYDENHDRYLVWDGGATVTALTPPATLPATNAWTVSALTVSTAVTTPTARATNRTWGRFRVSKRLNCAFGINRLDEKLYAFALE